MRLDYRTISGAIFLQGVVFLQTLTATTSYKGNKAEVGERKIGKGTSTIPILLPSSSDQYSESSSEQNNTNETVYIIAI
jgi:hypothetical protein